MWESPNAGAAASCRCAHNGKPWTATVNGEAGKTYGESCTSQNSNTGAEWCWVTGGTCDDQRMDSGADSLGFDNDSNWSYSFAACATNNGNGIFVFIWQPDCLYKSWLKFFKIEACDWSMYKMYYNTWKKLSKCTKYMKEPSNLVNQ